MRGAFRLSPFARPPRLLFARRPRPLLLRATMAAKASGQQEWRPLDVAHDELTLEHTLSTGQTFRWRKTGAHTYTGVIGRRVVQLRQQPLPSQPLNEKQPPPPPLSCWWRLASRPPTGTDPAAELAAAEAALRDYFNLGPDRPRLAELARGWAESDARYKAVASGLPGARMLRQPPLECLFSFVCSSNNHISRIHGMVERLSARYGSSIELEPWAARELSALAKKGAVVPATPATLGTEEDEEDEDETEQEWAAAAGAGSEDDVVVKVELVATPGGAKGGRSSSKAAARGDAADEAEAAATDAAPAFWAFPTLEQLASASEDALRADGFGYRARYIAGSVALLRAKAASADSASATASATAADDWLLSLRSPQIPLERAVELLTELPGVGPKVASCVALFSLDKHSAVPVDTHVWDLAKKFYARDALRGKSAPQAALHPIVQKAFVDTFGPYAGWAHNALFVGELPAFQGRVRAAARKGKGKEGLAAESGSEDDEEDEEDDGDADNDSDFELRTPAAKSSSGGGKKRKKAPSPASVARDERRRRREEKTGRGSRGGEEADDAPLPFALESVLS